jgi:hypothetical protein
MQQHAMQMIHVRLHHSRMLPTKDWIIKAAAFMFEHCKP